MSIPSFESYRAARLAEGFDEVAERVWAADTTVDTHIHPFSVQALVVQGEMWLTVGDHARHLQAGDSFVLDREAPHAERYGPAGATYWAARRRG